MGWVVEDIVCRWRAKFGVYGAFEWERFIDDCGLRWRVADLPASLPALIIGKTIFVRRGLDSLLTAYYVWHEIGHWACHFGSREFWLSRPQGYLTLSKMERQASEFALLFPVWGWDSMI